MKKNDTDISVDFDRNVSNNFVSRNELIDAPDKSVAYQWKNKKCKVIFYNGASKILVFDFDGVPVQITAVTEFDTDKTVDIQFKGKIGDNFEARIKK